MRVSEIAALLAASPEGDAALEITSAAPVETAGATDIAFASGRNAAELAAASAAGCLLVAPEFDNAAGRTVIRTPDPRAAFAAVLQRLYPAPAPPPGVHPTAVVDPSARLGTGVSVGPHASIGAETQIGSGSVIGAGCRIGRGVVLGERAQLHAGVTLYDGVRIGPRAVLHSGCVIGADGFGFAPVAGRWEKFPQVGCVVIGADFEAGANTCIDRAALGETRIGDGVKLDNLVHIAHNCRIGNHVVIAAQTGLSGGVIVEDGCIVGGQVGIGDKARIRSGAILGSKCGILPKKIVKGGEPLWGVPAKPLRAHLEQLALVARLPQMHAELAALRQRLAELEAGRK